MSGRSAFRRSAAVLAACFFLLPASTGSAQHVAEASPTDSTDLHTPRGALWRAAAAPGWGQIYNGQYYKLPVVWGGVAGFVGAALYTNHRYLTYRHAYFWTIRDDERVGLDVPAAWEEDYLELIRDLGLTPEEASDRLGRLSPLFKENRDILRRNRDLLYIGIGLFYGLTIVDAYVSAHLLDFDVSEDLAVSIRPSPAGIAARLLLR